jgi:polysaccharide export outer membrane protein
MDTHDSMYLRQSTQPSSHPNGQSSMLDRRFLVDLLCILVLVGVGSTGCSTPDPMPPPPAPPVQGYVVGAPDILFVTVLPEPEINREVRVRPDGMISIDLVGDVQAAGRTPFEIAAAIQKEIGRFKRDASVTVSVVDSPSRFVTIYGEVGRPGIFPLDTDTRISEAIGRVGGARPFASLNSVRVIRTIGRETRVIPVRLGDISQGDLSTNIAIADGDLIVVPPTILAKIGYAMQMLFFPFQPLIAGATSAGSIAGGAGQF